ncbi:hypothetical protein Fmac_017165 [Flemingia macrophylla]|uniref:CASP-like protein n=1 Tax=Flemingia macrophylla TaxID=520843 RepID=A0ABD1M1C3_9FABA
MWSKKEKLSSSSSSLSSACLRYEPRHTVAVASQSGLRRLTEPSPSPRRDVAVAAQSPRLRRAEHSPRLWLEFVTGARALSLIFEGDKFGFKDVYAYRYMISTIVIGFAYNLLQLVFSVFTVISGKRVIRGDCGYQFDFYGDKIISYFLISGATAGLSLNIELRNDLPSNSFLDKANISASLLLVGFLFTAIASIFTSFALPKKTIN